MTGDCHVRFYQRLGAKLPRPTNQMGSPGAAAGQGGAADLRHEGIDAPGGNRCGRLR